MELFKLPNASKSLAFVYYSPGFLPCFNALLAHFKSVRFIFPIMPESAEKFVCNADYEIEAGKSPNIIKEKGERRDVVPSLAHRAGARPE